MKNNLINYYNEKRYSKPMPVDGADRQRINFILKNIKDDGLKILDIGCWDGSYAIRYKKNSNIIYGIESSSTAALRAKKKGIIVEQGDFMENNFFRNTKFDVIVAGEIIEHIFETDIFVQKIRSMLNKNGILILTTPNVASLPRRILLFLGINPILENRSLLNISAGHIRYFTFSDMFKLLSDNKFKVMKSESDIVNFNNNGTLFTTILPKLYKRFGRTIMVVAKKQNG